MVIKLKKGERFNLSKSAPGLQQVAFALGWQVTQAEEHYDSDASAFMLGENGKIPDEGYFVFYNNQESLDGSVRHSGDERTGASEGDDETIDVDLSQVNSQIQELVFVVTIHEGLEKGQNFSQIENAYIRLSDRQTGNELARYDLTEDFSIETALEFGRLYKKNGEWRFQAVGQGYQAGLQSFVDRYYVENPPEDRPEFPVKDNTIAEDRSQKVLELERKLERQAPHIFNLVKTADISLKNVNLTNHQARVVLCLDISGSMSNLYHSGVIQKFAEKILALGCRFDDDGAINIFLFGGDAHNAGEMTLDNFQNFIQRILQEYPLEYSTNYAKAMQAIRSFYFHQGREKGINLLRNLWKSEAERPDPIFSEIPVYVMFVTDGNTAGESVTENQLKLSSYEPIFWQFMAIGSGGFRLLERLDEIGDRYLDNSDFFSVKDPKKIGDRELYDLLMAEYPNWVRSAQNKGLLP